MVSDNAAWSFIYKILSAVPGLSNEKMKFFVHINNWYSVRSLLWFSSNTFMPLIIIIIGIISDILQSVFWNSWSAVKGPSLNLPLLIDIKLIKLYYLIWDLHKRGIKGFHHTYLIRIEYQKSHILKTFQTSLLQLMWKTV
jgi:hypothetical protein